MAIPFNLPTQQDTDDNYEILDQLLEQLYEIMLEILRQRRSLRDSRSAIPNFMPQSKCYIPFAYYLQVITFLNSLCIFMVTWCIMPESK
jgi:hypothetical protein